MPRPRPTRDRARAPTACPSAPRPRRAAERPPLELARRIVELAEDKKAADIVLLDLAGLTTMADYFVICSGGSERQLDAIADGIIEGLRDEKTQADRARGDGGVALGAARLRLGRSSTSSRRPSATTTGSRSTGPRRRRSCASSSRVRV